MKLIFALFVYILSIEKAISISISSNELCIRVQNQCKGSYNYGLKYEIECKKSRCEGKLSFECGLDYCAQNRRSCEKILNLKYLIKSYKGFMFSKELKNYLNVIEGIRYCAVNEHSLQPNDVCINGDGCYSVGRLPFSIGTNKITKPINCLCPASHSFHCGEKFCAIHSDACGAFNKSGSNSIIKNCGNYKQIIKKILFF